MSKRLTALSIVVGIFIAVVLTVGCQQERDSTAASGSGNEILTEKATPVKIEGLDSTLGRITGRVIFKGERPAPQKLLVVKDVAVCGKQSHFDKRLVVGRNNGIQDVVISILNIKSEQGVEFKESQHTLDQTGCEYRPHVLILPVNKPLRVLNNDGILHNIHTYSIRNRAVNIAQPQFKKEMEMVFAEPEAVGVRCDIHGWMSAWIMVVDNPFCAVTDNDGNFILDDIPTGTYNLKCWQELLGEKTIEIKVESRATTSVVFQYSQ